MIPNKVLFILENEKKQLEDQIVECQERIKKINELIQQSKGVNIKWGEIVMKYLIVVNKPITTIEILSAAFKNNLEEIENPIRRRSHIQQLSLSLNRLCKKNILVSKNIAGQKGKIYYLKEWQETGRLKF